LDSNAIKLTSTANLSVQADEKDAHIDEIFDAVVTNGPINDAWRLTLWANYYTEPTFTVLLQEFDVGRDEFNVLSCLASYGSMVAKTICDVTGRPKNSISRAVNRLVERKMIRRKTNAHDRRESVLMLNDEGRRLYEKVVPVAVDRQNAMLDCLSAAERRTLDDILNRLMSARHQW
jgi:MarR family transcriptional regulator, temperature-dependent positive regulator of motility